MTSPSPIANGVYYISSQISSTYLTLESGAPGTNVTAWSFDGAPHQQWLVSLNGSGYSFQNQAYNTYIGHGTAGLTGFYGSPGFAAATLTSEPWLIQEYKGGFVVGTVPQPFLVFNLYESVNFYANATPLLVYPFYVQLGPENQVWYFNSTSSINSPTSTSTPSCTAVHPTSLGVIAGSVIAGVLTLLLSVIIAFWIGKRWGASAAVRNIAAVSTTQATPPSVASNIQGVNTSAIQPSTSFAPAGSSSAPTTSQPYNVAELSDPITTRPMYDQPSSSPAPEYSPPGTVPYHTLAPMSNMTFYGGAGTTK